MRLITPAHAIRAWQWPAIAAAVAALAAQAGPAWAGQPAGVVVRTGPHVLRGRVTPPQELERRSLPQGPESSRAGLDEQVDPALRRGPAKGASVIRWRRGEAPSGKSLCPARTAGPWPALPEAALAAGREWSHGAAVRMRWPLGQSASESVVLLRRLLI